jgi:sec-independent protein translocase protein TatC
MARTAGEMPFLDHLEELRSRILRSLGALIVAFGAGFWLVQRFKLVNFLQGPIQPYLTDGKLTVLSPTDPVMITFKLSFVTGLVLASPVIIWQIWAFLSPALYEKERKALVPSLFVGLGLFLLGCTFAWVFVVPKAISVLLTFQEGAFNLMFTYDAWFSFVLQILLALGISAELPLLLIILTALGLTSPGALHRFRRVAIVLSCIAGAFLSPGTDIVSMLMMTVPLILLYEVGIAGSIIVHRRRLRRAAATAALIIAGLALFTPRAEAQIPGQRRDSLADTLQRRAGRIDTASARRLGLPTSPSRTFPAPDTVMAALMDLDGYFKTRYLSDSANLNNADRAVRLGGRAMTERDNRILEAAHIEYREAGCDLVAEGDPRMFEGPQVLVGNKVRYDTCAQRGVVDEALTTFEQGMGNWFIRGNFAVDSSAVRVFAAQSEITSCDLPVPDYHFAAKEVKWVSRSLLVARPAVLYIRDVPIAWIPFIFQETKPGRRSGILVPQFGFNDIVRPDPGYNRQVTNAGYYWAPNDYFDAAVRFDWYADRNTRWTLSTQYNVLDRFFRGAIDYSRLAENTGAVSQQIRWQHQQSFGLTTTLSVNLDYATNSRVVNNNAIDPLQNTQQMNSALNFTKRYNWGSITAGGRRSQTIGTDQVSMTLPTFAVNPKPLDITPSITWSPTLTFTNQLNTAARTYLTFPKVGGGLDSVEQTPSSRLSTLAMQTPLRIGNFTWQNSVAINDGFNERLSPLVIRIPNPNTPDPTDSVEVNQQFASTFSSTIDWDTGINLPLLFRSSWKLTPSIGVTNRTAGSFAVRNERTDGNFVVQGKRLNFGLAAAPTLFGLFGGIGPISAIRHTFSPLINWAYAPEAAIPEEYARAVASTATTPLQLKSRPTQTLSFAMSNNFEAKERLAPGDTMPGVEPRKFRLLNITTSGITYDFEQAKVPGRQGWATQTLSNSFLSDLVPGFNLQITHDLWDREVSNDSAQFDPFLQSVSASFGLSANTFRAIGSLFGLGKPPDRAAPAPAPGQTGTFPSSVMGAGGVQQRTLYATNQLAGARRPFTANVNLTISRTRANLAQDIDQSSNSTIGFSTSFSPTRFWGVTWQTMYNITTKTFDGQIVRLERDLHDWRAGFNFVKNPNGNFALYFSIHLVDLPDLKLDYNQTSIR